MQIKLQQNHTHEGRSLVPGDVIEADERLVAKLSRLGVSYEVVEPVRQAKKVQAVDTGKVREVKQALSQNQKVESSKGSKGGKRGIFR